MPPARSPEQHVFSERFDRFCQQHIRQRARGIDKSGAVPRDVWQALVDVGYLGLFHPVEVGGTAADGITIGLAMESLAKACGSTFWAVSISTALCGKMIHELCTEEHHRVWLGPIVRGEKIGCFAASEDGPGSDPGAYRTSLRSTPSGWVLRGRKSRVSNAVTADVAVVLARQDSTANAGLCYVVVDLKRPGIQRSEIPKLGLRGMSWGVLEFDDVVIPHQDVILNASMDKILASVEWGQLLQTFCAIGLAAASLEASLSYAAERTAFGRPIGHLPVVHGRLADVRAELDAARLLALDASRVKGEGEAARELVVMAKIYATEMAVRAADVAMRTFGGWGFSEQHDVERFYRDSLANVPAGLPTDRLREFLACGLVGVDPWTYPPFDWLEPAGLSVTGDRWTFFQERGDEAAHAADLAIVEASDSPELVSSPPLDADLLPSPATVLLPSLGAHGSARVAVLARGVAERARGAGTRLLAGVWTAIDGWGRAE